MCVAWVVLAMKVIIGVINVVRLNPFHVNKKNTVRHQLHSFLFIFFCGFLIQQQAHFCCLKHSIKYSDICPNFGKSTRPKLFQHSLVYDDMHYSFLYTKFLISIHMTNIYVINNVCLNFKNRKLWRSVMINFRLEETIIMINVSTISSLQKIVADSHC